VELREELIARGAAFRTKSDTEPARRASLEKVRSLNVGSA